MLRGIELAKSCRRYWPGLSEMPASAEPLHQHRVNRTNNKQSTQFSRCQTAGVQGVENEGFQQVQRLGELGAERRHLLQMSNWQQPQRIFDDSALVVKRKRERERESEEHVTALFRSIIL